MSLANFDDDFWVWTTIWFLKLSIVSYLASISLFNSAIFLFASVKFLSRFPTNSLILSFYFYIFSISFYFSFIFSKSCLSLCSAALVTFYFYFSHYYYCFSDLFFRSKHDFFHSSSDFFNAFSFYSALRLFSLISSFWLSIISLYAMHSDAFLFKSSRTFLFSLSLAIKSFYNLCMCAAA